MYLRCKICGNGTMIAKFYPSAGFILGEGSNAGWYTPSPVNGYSEKQAREVIIDRLNALFENCHHDLDASSVGGYQYELEYEIDQKNA